MKKRILLFTAASAFAFVILKSNTNGPGGNYTGSSGGTATCSGGGCHTSSSTSGIKLGIRLDSMGIPVTKYKAGMTYTIVLLDTNTTSSTLPKHGFECSIVKGSGSTSSRVGQFGVPPTSTDTQAVGGRPIWGHRAPLSPASGTGATGTVYIDSIKWTAPATAGSGTVTIFSIMNDVLVNGDPGGVDSWNNMSASFQEWTSPGVGVTNVDNDMTVNAFPNPCINNLHVQLGNGNYTVQAYDLSGKLMGTLQATGMATINTSGWAAGRYNIVVSGKDASKTIAVVKQ